MPDPTRPAGREQPIPYLCVREAVRAIDFYCRVFGAVETVRLADPGGKIGHAELAIGSGTLMLSDEFPEMEVWSPHALGGSPVTIHLHVADVDEVAARAVAAGARVLRPVEDQFYGDRGGQLEDPFGHLWWIATAREPISAEEMKRRAAALYGAS